LYAYAGYFLLTEQQPLELLFMTVFDLAAVKSVAFCLRVYSYHYTFGGMLQYKPTLMNGAM